MKKIINALALSALVAAFAAIQVSGFAEDTKTTRTATAKSDAKTTKSKSSASAGKKSDAPKAASVKPANNANCPISGQPVGSMQAGSHIIYEGYKIGLCCDGCKAKFNSDPDHYLNKALGH